MRLRPTAIKYLVIYTFLSLAPGCIEDPAQIRPPSFSDASSPYADAFRDSETASDSSTDSATDVDTDTDTDGNTGSDTDATAEDDTQTEVGGATPDAVIVPEACPAPVPLGIEPPIFSWSFESIAPYDGELPIPLMSPSPTYTTPCSLAGCDSPIYLVAPFRSMPGRFGQGIAFDGMAGFGAIAHHPDMLINEGTIAFWFNMPAPEQNVWRALFSKDAFYYADGGHISFAAEDGRLIVRLQRHDGYSPDDTRSITLRSGQVLEPNQWHHALLTFDDRRRVLYLDGVEVAANQDGYLWGLGTHGLGGEALPAELPALAGNHEPISLGATNWSSASKTLSDISFHNPVVLDEVAIYDRALTVPEISLLQRVRLGNAGARLALSVDWTSDTSNPSLIIPGHLLRSADAPFTSFDAGRISTSLDPWVDLVLSRAIVSSEESEELHLSFASGRFGDRATIPIEVAPCQFIDLDLHWRAPRGAMPVFEQQPLDFKAAHDFPCARITAIVPAPSDSGWDLWVALRHCEGTESTLVRLKEIQNDPRQGRDDQWAPYGPVQVDALAQTSSGVAIGTSVPNTGGFRVCAEPLGCADSDHFWPADRSCTMGRAISSPDLNTVFVPCVGQRHAVGLSVANASPSPWFVHEFGYNYNNRVRAVTRFQAPGVTPTGGLTLAGRNGNQIALQRYFEINRESPAPRDTLLYDGQGADRFLGVAAGDVDFDGVDDYLLTFRDRDTFLGLAGADSSIRWLTESGQYSGRWRQNVSFEPVAADFSRNGRAEFIAAEGSSPVTLMSAAMQNTSPFIHRLALENVACRGDNGPGPCTFASRIIAIEVLDVDGDGRPDLLIATDGQATGDGARPTLYLLRNLGM